MQEWSFNDDWLFTDPADGRRAVVTLPHDAMINTPRDPNTKPYFLLAGFHGSDYTYTKQFTPGPQLAGKRLFLEFEAVYCMSEVFVNGVKMAEKAYSFTPFHLELTACPSWNPAGENQIKVVAHVPYDGHSRWYTGGGIYRPVHLYAGGEAWILPQGLRVTTLSIHPARVRVEVECTGGEEVALSLEDGGAAVARGTAQVREGRAVWETEVPDAKLWDAESPALYTVRAALRKEGRTLDTAQDTFGIRTLSADPQQGLRINGKPVFLRGGCIHNDMGVMGVINNDATELHRARKIKQAGFNAIRSAHHPMSRSLMKACDQVGLYVMDEAFDHWYRMKNLSPYVAHFETDFKTDVRAMVRDAYNHPSVLIYSIGNEIPEAGSVKGVRIGREIVDTIHALDTTRLTVLCPSVHWLREYLEGTPYLTEDEDEWMAKDPANKAKDWQHYVKIFLGAAANLPDEEKNDLYPPTYRRADEEATKNLYPYLDLAGYNYYEDKYEILHQLHPERVLLGTETRCTMLVNTMRFARSHPYLIGDFVWTLQDHLGEANCGNLHYTEDEDYKGYPWLINYGGVIDINGLILPAIHRFEFAWDPQKHGLYLASQPPVHGGKAPLVQSYRWTDTVEGWSYEGYDGQPTFVDAYTDAASVSLFLNGEPVGSAPVEDYFAKIPCTYHPGTLTAVGYDADGRELYRTTVHSADPASTRLEARADRTRLIADGQDFAFVDITVTDDAGIPKLLPEHLVSLGLEGPGQLQGFGSAWQKNDKPYNLPRHKTWLGRLRAVIRTTRQPGVIRVHFASEGCRPVTVELHAEPAGDPAAPDGGKTTDCQNGLSGV